jgi:hypothetical protein
MRQKPVPAKEPAHEVVKDTCRATRRISAEDCLYEHAFCAGCIVKPSVVTIVSTPESGDGIQRRERDNWYPRHTTRGGVIYLIWLGCPVARL